MFSSSKSSEDPASLSKRKKSSASIQNHAGDEVNGSAAPEVGKGSPGKPINDSEPMSASGASQNPPTGEERGVDGVHTVESPARSQEQRATRVIPANVPGEGGNPDNPGEMEGVVDVLDVKRPPLFWWSEYKPGQRVIGTLMAIGFIYSLAQKLKELHEFLLNDPRTRDVYLRLIKFAKAIWIFFATVGFLIYDIYKIIARDFAPKTIYMYFHDFERFLKYLYHSIDRWMANKISRIIWYFPRMQETPMEILDDCIHQYKRDVCKLAHPASETPRYKEIEDSRAAKRNRGRLPRPVSTEQ